MDKLETRYYTRAQIKEMGLSLATLDLWSARFRKVKSVFDPLSKAPWVCRPKDAYLLHYSEDFVSFLRARQGKTGPSSLPSPERIMFLITGSRAGLTTEQIAQRTGDPLAVIQMQLDYLEVENATSTQETQS